MKKITVGILFVVIHVFFLNAYSNAALLVTDYYRLCPAEFFGGQKPTLEMKKSSWVTDTGMAVVDIKNGYIECGYRGDGEQIMQFVLYVKNDKTPIVGISRYYHAGVAPFKESADIRFVEYRDNRFSDITGSILSTIDCRLFVKAGFNAAALDRIRSFKVREYLEYRYQLPQEGTNAVVELLTGRLVDYLKEKGKVIPPWEKDICNKFMDNLINTGIELKWDAKNTKYVPWRKTRVSH